MKKDIGVGIDDFKQMIREDVYYVDKTEYIKEIIDDKNKVILVTRPRRFGKTLNMSMLSYYFDITKKDTKELFKGLKIMNADEKYLSKMNGFPCINISLAKVRAGSFDEMILALKSTMLEVYREHRYLTESDKLYEEDKENIKDILYLRENQAILQNSVLDLTYYLYNHFGKEVILLMDEYDVPLQNAYVHGYYDKAIEFFKTFFVSALKDNKYLQKGILTRSIKNSKRKPV